MSARAIRRMRPALPPCCSLCCNAPAPRQPAQSGRACGTPSPGRARCRPRRRRCRSPSPSPSSSPSSVPNACPRARSRAPARRVAHSVSASCVGGRVHQVALQLGLAASESTSCQSGTVGADRRAALRMNSGSTSPPPPPPRAPSGSRRPLRLPRRGLRRRRATAPSPGKSTPLSTRI